MNKFNAPSYQRKVTNHKNRRNAVISALTSYIQDVVKENGTITFPEPKKFRMSHDEVVALHWGRCPKPYMEGETYDEGVVLELSIPKISRGFLPNAAPLSSSKMSELMEVAVAIEELTHSPAPLDDLAKEVETLGAIYQKESSEMIAWITEATVEMIEIRFSKPLSIPALFDSSPIVAVKYALAKSTPGSKEKVEQVCLMVEAENKLIGKFEKKVPLAICRKNLAALLQLAKEIDKAVSVEPVEK
ncbi:hypothetical protein [uncultured Duncaniella sp.]|uniref:hypothetical protein n=1 Tax=uncultured Duncaniella sp. TaxID=2768039 RepID=UPI000F490E5F|nr:hypothetical protein [uncultured Duncaniella sp.]ROT11693.1 hypothetical protein EEL50_13405 [Muribaculaceae bacterium Isolate-105 (HZI)]